MYSVFELFTPAQLALVIIHWSVTLLGTEVYENCISLSLAGFGPDTVLLFTYAIYAHCERSY